MALVSMPLLTYFEGVEALVWVHLAPGGSKAVCGQLLDLGDDVPLKPHVHVAMVLVQVVLELGVGQLVARFKLSVVFCLLLNCVVRQMHHSIAQIGERELTTARSKVSLLVVVGLEVAVLGRGHAEGANVELASMDQQRVVNVLLDDACAFT